MRMTLRWMKLDSAGTDSCLAGFFGWIVRTSKTQCVSFASRVGTATKRDGANVERLLRCLVGNPMCKRIAGCTLNVLGAAGTPQCSVMVVTDADWCVDVSDRCSYSRVAVCVEGSTLETWYPVCVSSRTPKHGLLEFWRVRADGTGGWGV